MFSNQIRSYLYKNRWSLKTKVEFAREKEGVDVEECESVGGKIPSLDTVLKGNSGEGESIDADTAFSLASYATAYATGSMYKTMKEGAEFIKNFLDLITKGKDIKDGVEKAMTDDTSKGSKNSLPMQTESKNTTVSRSVYLVVKGDAYNKDRVHKAVKDTVINEGNEDFVKQLDKRDSIRVNSRLR